MAQRTESGFKSIQSLTSALSPDREKLRKISWLPDVLRINGSVISRIIGPVLTVTLFSTGIAVLSEVYGWALNLSNNVVPLLSVVVGLILVFRNGTSYDRYYEGRKDIGSLTATVRNMARLIWLQVCVPPAKPKPVGDHNFLSLNDGMGGAPDPHPAAALKAEKIRLIRLLLSFVYATVHHLRGEYGTDYEDYEGVLPNEFQYSESATGVDQNTLYNRYATYSSIGGGIATQVLAATRRPSTSSPRPSFQHGGRPDSPVVAITDSATPLLTDNHTTVQFNPRATETFLPLPLVIAHEITKILLKFKKKGCIEVGGPAGFNTYNTFVSGMVNQLTNLERVATTPIPTSYGIHLKQCVTLYLFTLPFTLVQTMHWNMIPLVTLVSFTLMGIEGIADEIEMPFGRDQSDLPLERYCAALRSEVEYIINRLPDGVEDEDPFA